MKRYRYWCTLIVLVATTATGCAGFFPPKTVAKGDLTPDLKKRAEQCARDFEEKRDFAEFEAAKSRWEHHRDAEGCKQGLEKLLARNPKHRDARLLMVELLLNEDDADAAYREALSALDSHPSDSQVQFTVALTLDAQGKVAEAIGYYERAHKMAPDNADFASAYETARELARQPKRPVSQKDVPIATTEHDADALTDAELVGYAMADAPMPPSSDPSDSSEAAGFAETASEIGDGSAKELLRKGETALTEGSPQTALKWFRQAADTKPYNPQIPITAAASALRANQPEIAIELLSAAAKKSPKSVAVHRMLGATYYRMGDYRSSQLSLQQALSLDKSNALSYLLMGCTLAKLGQREAAETHFRQARALNPRYSIAR